MHFFEEYYRNLEPELKAYFKIVSPEFPDFLIPFIETETMQRLGKIDYFCGMYKASKAIYHFKYYLTRLDHSISVALITWHFTKNKEQTLAALFHDAGTPAFSHVIDYLNNDLVIQESTEIDLNEVLNQDQGGLELFEKIGLLVEQVAEYKAYPLVDNKRPKLCADRLDGIFISNLVWVQGTNLEEIKKIYADIDLATNEDDELEFNFKSKDMVALLLKRNQEINTLTHSDNDYYFMHLLASIVRHLINMKIISYEDLYLLTEDVLYEKIEKATKIDEELTSLYQEFTSLEVVPPQKKMPIKERIIAPLVNGQRFYGK